MSLLTRPKRPGSSVVSSAPSTADSPRNAHEPEAPEWGRSEREAPETRVTRHREAPDAGEGGASHVDHEFTHGRSQS